jgi:hypothetical protein
LPGEKDSFYKEILKCPAEENANCAKSLLISARRSFGRIDTRRSNAFGRFDGVAGMRWRLISRF